MFLLMAVLTIILLFSTGGFLHRASTAETETKGALFLVLAVAAYTIAVLYCFQYLLDYEMEVSLLKGISFTP